MVRASSSSAAKDGGDDASTAPNGSATTAKSKDKSFSISLTQALLTSDKKLLEKLLSSKDTHAIEDTVSQLNPPLVLSLLEFISTNLMKSPNQLYSREGWIHTILRSHTSFFVKNKKGREALERLNKHINQRLSTNKALLKLKGKVDSVVYLSSLSKKKKTKEVEARESTKEPMVTFNEAD